MAQEQKKEKGKGDTQSTAIHETVKRLESYKK